MSRESIKLENGRYEVILNQASPSSKDWELEEGFTFRALRYGEEWRDLIGDNLIFAMFNRIKELEKKLSDTEQQLEIANGVIEGKIAIKGNERNVRYPFNLERALAGDSVVTRDGRPVKIAGYNPDAAPQHKICGWIDGAAVMWNEEGHHSLMSPSGDLFMAPKPTRTVWVNLYAKGSKFYHDANCHGTEEEANFIGHESRIGGRAWPIEISE